MDKNLFTEILTGDMWYFILVSLFSADTLIDLESCEKSLTLVNEMEELLPDVEGITEERRKEVAQELSKAKEVIERDLDIFKRGKEG